MNWRAVILLMTLLLVARWGMAVPTSRPTTLPSSTSSTAAVDFGPDVVMLKQLAALYQPVPFSHRRHAEMAEMWSGCTTCHHRPPRPTTQPTTVPVGLVAAPHGQEEAGEIPACQTCHAVAPERVSLRVPSLKGAYHRQCLNCHLEWAGANQCGSCHAPADGTDVATIAPLPDDIVGRMHPPMAEPDVKLFRIRVAPVAGPNVFFRHREHVEVFGLQCSSCHRRDTCADCHASTGNGNGHANGNGKSKPGPHPLQIGRTWRESHVPCTSCHADDACVHCHYRDDQPAPPAFEHASTGQLFDENHYDLACASCHEEPRQGAPPTCGDAKCHMNPEIEFPSKRPGPVIAAASSAPTSRPTTVPATRPTVIRIRRGGS